MNAVTRTTQLFDIGDPGAPVGSPAWCRAALYRITELKRQSQSAVSSLKYRLLAFAREQHFTKIADRDGVAFATWEDFVQYPEPFGLGMRVEVVRAIMAEQDDRKLLRDVVEAVPTLAKHGAIGRGRNRVDNIKSIGGTSATYLIARLKRDRPDIAERLAAGEFPSARAAARAAGFKVDTPPLVIARRAWKRMTPDDRAAFLREVT